MLKQALPQEGPNLRRAREERVTNDVNCLKSGTKKKKKKEGGVGKAVMEGGGGNRRKRRLGQVGFGGGEPDLRDVGRWDIIGSGSEIHLRKKANQKSREIGKKSRFRQGME